MFFLNQQFKGAWKAAEDLSFLKVGAWIAVEDLSFLKALYFAAPTAAPVSIQGYANRKRFAQKEP